MNKGKHTYYLHSANNLIVEVNPDCSGYVVWSTNETYPVGHYSIGWNLSVFREINVEILVNNCYFHESELPF